MKFFSSSSNRKSIQPPKENIQLVFGIQIRIHRICRFLGLLRVRPFASTEEGVRRRGWRGQMINDQCCGFGSGIRSLFDPGSWILIVFSGSWIQNPYFSELKDKFWGKNSIILIWPKKNLYLFNNNIIYIFMLFVALKISGPKICLAPLLVRCLIRDPG